MYVLYPADGDVLQPDSPIRYDGRLVTDHALELIAEGRWLGPDPSAEGSPAWSERRFRLLFACAAHSMSEIAKISVHLHDVVPSGTGRRAFVLKYAARNAGDYIELVTYGTSC